MNRTLLICAALAAVLPLCGCVNRASQAQAKRTQAIILDKTVPVVVTPVSTADLKDEVEVTGSIMTSEDTTVGAIVAGKLIAVMVKDGDTVGAGQVIAQQDTQDASTRVRQAAAVVDAARSALAQAKADAGTGPSKSSAGVRAAEAQLKQAKAVLQKLRNGARLEERKQAEAAVSAAKSAMETAKSAAARAKNLYAQGAIAKSTLEQAETAYAAALAQYESALQSASITQNYARPEDIAAAEQQVRAAEEQVRISQANKVMDVVYPERVAACRAQLDSAQEGLRLARKALADTTIRAPFAGRISGKPMQVGSYASAGTGVARLVGPSGLYFDGNVPEAVVARVSIGAPVTVTVDALGGKSFTGSVVAVNPQASPVARQFGLRIQFSGDMASLKPGMFARGMLQLGVARNATVIPADAVLRDGEVTYVFLAEGSKAKRAEVKTGIQSGQMMQVSGLSIGSQVVKIGQNKLYDGCPVKLEKRDGSGESADAKAGS